MTNAREILTELRRSQIIPDAYTRWETYRDSVTEHIISQSPAGSRIAVFGAGRSADLDLAVMSGYFENIALFDRDIEAMDEALQHYGLSGSSRIQIYQSDFTGIDDADYFEYINLITGELSRMKYDFNPEDIVTAAIGELDRIYANAQTYTPDFGEDRFDVAVVLGVHSQLNNMPAWIWTALLELVRAQNIKVPIRVAAENDAITSRFNKAVLRAAHGRVIIGCERSSFDTIGAVEGALQGMNDIRKRAREGELNLVSSRTLTWPFSDRKSYQMEILTADVL